LATDWNGGYRTTEFLTAARQPRRRWIALYSDQKPTPPTTATAAISDPDGVLKDGGRDAISISHWARPKLGGNTARPYRIADTAEGYNYLLGGMRCGRGAAHPGADDCWLVLPGQSPLCCRESVLRCRPAGASRCP
jgi:hypothetical protein